MHHFATGQPRHGTQPLTVTLSPLVEYLQLHVTHEGRNLEQS